MASIRKSRINTCLWFDGNAEEAVKFYSKIFKKFKTGKISYYGEGSFFPAGTVLTISFQIEGQTFLALNGGSQFKFNESISFVINCKDQKEINYFWEKLSKGGEKSMCGWLKDKFGVSWQVVPENLDKLLTDKNPERVKRVMDELFKMQKIEIAKLKKAFLE